MLTICKTRNIIVVLVKNKLEKKTELTIKLEFPDIEYKKKINLNSLKVQIISNSLKSARSLSFISFV